MKKLRFAGERYFSFAFAMRTFLHDAESAKNGFGVFFVLVIVIWIIDMGQLVGQCIQNFISGNGHNTFHFCFSLVIFGCSLGVGSQHYHPGFVVNIGQNPHDLFLYRHKRPYLRGKYQRWHS